MDGLDDYEVISSAVMELVLENESQRMNPFFVSRGDVFSHGLAL
jgi:hypothetical protein